LSPVLGDHAELVVGAGHAGLVAEVFFDGEGLAVPVLCRTEVTRNAQTFLVADAEIVARIRIARFSGLAQQIDRFAGVLRLGEGLARAGAIECADDVFFLTYAELTQAPSTLRDAVTRRRAEWQRQRRLVAPLEIGQPPRMLAGALSGVTHSSTELAASADVIVGQAASPGRATGRARVVAGPEDFAAFQPGEIVIARATAPAWTPLFAKAAAVVTDAGTLAAHASLVAREYGIPAVVGTTDATRRLRTGDVVTVDGSLGRVLIVRG